MPLFHYFNNRALKTLCQTTNYNSLRKSSLVKPASRTMFPIVIALIGLCREKWGTVRDILTFERSRPVLFAILTVHTIIYGSLFLYLCTYSKKNPKNNIAKSPTTEDMITLRFILVLFLASSVVTGGWET